MATTTILPFTRLSTELSTFKESISNSYENKQDDAVLQELLQECQLKIISLKMLTRNVFSIIQEQRKNVTKEKEVADTAHLQLQNLLYEKNLLLNEIKSCDHFKTPEYDKIELVSEKIFKKDAPNHLTKIDKQKSPHGKVAVRAPVSTKTCCLRLGVLPNELSPTVTTQLAKRHI